MTKKSEITPVECVEEVIFIIRGKRVILDRDLAKLYGVQTKRLNEQVKRNIERFPVDFMFQLNKREFENLKSQIATSNSQMKMSLRKQPFAFTEHGALMTGNVLKSQKAISVSIDVVKAFIELRKFTKENENLIKEVYSLKNFVLKNSQESSQEFRKVWGAIEKLLTPEPSKNQRKIGFDLTKALSQK